ncbi:hypothetical protein AB9K41_09965 [Cribrihabitans sp. XS_ASV171]
MKVAAKDADLLFEQIEESSVPSLNFYFMLGMATAIASFGLLSNSAPAIIGAMIVAPLMSPIIGFSFAACQSASNRDPLSASNIDPSGAELARRCVVLM